jgi:chromosome segregation ATPase
LNERLRLDQIVAGVRKDNEQILGNIRDLASNNDIVKRKIEDFEKYLTKLKIEENALKEKIMGYENENNGLDEDLSAVVESITKFEYDISNSQNELSNLQGNIAETAGLA